MGYHLVERAEGAATKAPDEAPGELEVLKRKELDAAGRTEEIAEINVLSMTRVLVCHCM